MIVEIAKLLSFSKQFRNQYIEEASNERDSFGMDLLDSYTGERRHSAIESPENSV